MTRPVLPEGALPEALRLAVRGSVTVARRRKVSAATPAHVQAEVRADLSATFRAATTPRVATEWEEQVRLVAWAAWAAGDPLRAAEVSGQPRLLDQFVQAYGEAEAGAWPALAGLVAVPNGTRASPAASAKAKAEGVRAGYPDLLLDVAKLGPDGRPFFGFRLELKRAKGGKVSPDQAWWYERLTRAGYYVSIQRGMEPARAVLLAYLALPDFPTTPRTP